MAEPIITAENLSKKYRIGIRELKARTFREAVVDALAAPLRNLRRLRQLTRFDDRVSNGAEDGRGAAGPSTGDTIWALKDVSFTVQPGEVVGIIGRNGAGKSTLLKILSRITEPTSGEVKLNGRVSSLLEVGTGFHPELTGRENIYLNGTILGMRKAEIDRKFDEIVAFSEIEKFLDTPVKRYSSGMYVRLAFAVAAHLEPEILLVDEVLAVGDAAFQKKCLGKMGHVAREGRTVLFVSHNIAAVHQLCPQTILLEDGRLTRKDSTAGVIEGYLSSTARHEISSFYQAGNLHHPQDKIFFKRCWITDSTNRRTSELKYGEPFSVHLEVVSRENMSDLAIQVGINSAAGLRILTSDSEEFGYTFNITSSSPLGLTLHMDGLWLMPGTYALSKLMIRKGKHELTTLLDLFLFEVSQQPMDTLTPPMVNTGLIAGKSTWETKQSHGPEN